MAFGDFTVDRNSTKYVLGNGGTIVPVATDEPAIEFNADGTYKGLLVEPAATNICLQSEDITTTWGADNVTLTANDTTAPDGNATADKLADDATNGRHRINQFFSFTSGTTYTLSFFVKKVSSGRFLLLNANTAFNARAALNLDTLAITNINGTEAKVADYGNGWYRFSVTGTATSTATVPVYVQMQDNASDSLYVGDGSSFYLWGAQLEEGPIATSYIPTASAAVTRVLDDITQTGAQSLIGQTQGTLYIEVDWKETSGVSQHLLNVSDGTNENRVLIYNTSTGELRMFIKANNVTQTSQGESSSGYSSIQKFAFAYADNDFELYRNGSSISSDTGSLAALATMTDIDLGQTYDATLQANMHIRAVAIYPTRLGAVELEVLTGAPTYGSYALMASSLGYTVA